MPYLVGVDEAGYGPNLGPLLVSASVWEVPHPPEQVDLYALLEEGVASSVARGNAGERLILADSKLLYRPGTGLRLLEESFLAALGCSHWPATWRDIWAVLAPASAAAISSSPWYADYDCPLPRTADAARIKRLHARFDRSQGHAGARLRRISSRAVFPEQFNAAVRRFGNKAEALSRISLDLVRELIDQLPGEPILVQCDKHGGRNHYQAMLQQLFCDDLVQVIREGARSSHYRCGSAERRVDIRFVAKGESFPPAALASMACKYLRELAMEAFNHFWTRQVADLKPTAGYPVDARRFKLQIQDAQEKLGIDDQILWRER